MLLSPKLPIASDPRVSATKHVGQGIVRVGKAVSQGQSNNAAITQAGLPLVLLLFALTT